MYVHKTFAIVDSEKKTCEHAGNVYEYHIKLSVKMHNMRARVLACMLLN